MKAALRMSAIICGFLACSSAYAQTIQPTLEDDPSQPAQEATEENVEVEEMAEESEEDSDAYMNELLSQARQGVPGTAMDYDEINAIRVLERNILPSRNEERSQVSTGGLGALHGRDPMGLGSERSVRMMIREANVNAPSTGFQQQSDRAFRDALALVQKEMEPYRKDSATRHALNLPFGLDCIEEPAVQEFLALFSAPGSKTIKIWLQRGGKWQKLITDILREEKMPEDLFYLAMIESGFKTRVKSPANAGGMWQFIPGTGIDMGLTINEYVDERFDPVKATHAAANYLRRQYQRFNAWPLAMAAYNGGPGTVNVAIDRFNSNDYFKLVKYGAMYDETRKYVPKILAAALIGKNPEVFGFEGLKKDDPIRFDTVTVPGDVRLSLLADAAGCSVDTLKELNPELLKDQTPGNVDNYELRIPYGSFRNFVSKYDNLFKQYGNKHETVILKYGQTIEMLADELGVPARVLRSINQFGPKERAPYHSEILVPENVMKNAHPVAKPEEKDPRIALLPSEDFAMPDKKRFFYFTNKDDSLSEISAFLNISKMQLALWNDLDTSAKLRENMVLQVFLAPNADISDIILYDETQVKPMLINSKEYVAWREASAEAHRAKSSKGGKASSKGGKSASAAKTTSKSYTVVKGDSLSKIAKKYGVTVDNLKKWNNLGKSGNIRPGMRLVIHK